MSPCSWCPQELIIQYRPRGDLANAMTFSTSTAVVEFVSPLLKEEAVEVTILLCLTTKHRLIGFHYLARGSLDSCIVHPREIFKVAMLANAASVILVHNHPSGDPIPSQQDRLLTARLQSASELVGIPLLDHLIVTREGASYSLLNHRLTSKTGD